MVDDAIRRGTVSLSRGTRMVTVRDQESNGQEVEVNVDAVDCIWEDGGSTHVLLRSGRVLRINDNIDEVLRQFHAIPESQH